MNLYPKPEKPSTQEELDALVKNHPREALQYADRLNDEQFGFCADKFLYFAMQYDADRLTPAQIQTAYRVYPTGAIQFAAHRLTPEELLPLVKQCLDLVRMHLQSTPPPPRLLPALIKISDRLDQKTRSLLKKAIAKQI